MGVFEAFIIALGVLSVCAAVLDWEWYMNHRKARLLISVIGRPAARAIYVLFGLAFIAWGGLAAAGIIPGIG